MALLLKVCGITTLEDARFCAGAGADFLGFVQHPGSPRFIPPQDARDIINWLYGPEAVGVFVDVSPEEMNRVSDEAGFALVQVHGELTPEDCARVDRPVIKAFGVEPDTTAEDLAARMEPYRPHVAHFLLDTRIPGQWGGTGRTFDWDIARRLASSFSLLLAGGISAHNVVEAVRRVAPAGVDLSSSLESTPGRKDLDKMQTFFDAISAVRPA